MATQGMPDGFTISYAGQKQNVGFIRRWLTRIARFVIVVAVTIVVVFILLMSPVGMPALDALIDVTSSLGI